MFWQGGWSIVGYFILPNSAFTILDLCLKAWYIPFNDTTQAHSWSCRFWAACYSCPLIWKRLLSRRLIISIFASFPGELYSLGFAFTQLSNTFELPAGVGRNLRPKMWWPVQLLTKYTQSSSEYTNHLSSISRGLKPRRILFASVSRLYDYTRLIVRSYLFSFWF